MIAVRGVKEAWVPGSDKGDKAVSHSVCYSDTLWLSTVVSLTIYGYKRDVVLLLSVVAVCGSEQ